ncbi:MAG: hypothetical protein II200_04670 [Bacteroidaceae bacterium]|nr:hypothetical protein [Bacteroidaceae bacterium]
MIQITNYVPTNTETDKKEKKATSIVKKSKKKKKYKNSKTLNYYNAGTYNNKYEYGLSDW